MRFFAYLRSLVARLFHRSSVEDDLNEELRSHLRHRADDLFASGLRRADAERQARLEFGASERLKEEVRETFGGSFIEVLFQDVRFSLRVLRKSRGFTTVAVLTLALAIGANAVVFGILNAIILHPLNIPDPQNLFMLENSRGLGNASYPDYLDFRDRNRTFDGIAALNINAAGLDNGDTPTRAWVLEASANYFDLLGVQPYLGRVFHVADEHGPNSAPYIVLTYSYWQNQFQGDRAVIGRVVQLNKHPFTIVGVTPPDFHGTVVFASPDFFVPIVNQEQIEGVNLLNQRGNRWVFSTIGRLKKGVTPAQAVADLNSIEAYLEKTYPKDETHVQFALSAPSLVGSFMGPPVRAFVTALMLLAGMILLAACANLGSLFAARAADRSREVALRLALGASRSRILRALFTEALLISLAGGALGLWASVQLLRGLTTWQPVPRFPVLLPLSPDASVYVIALLLALLSALLFGAVPIRQVLRVDSYQIVKSGSAAPPGRRISTRDILLGVQIAICALLVTSSFVAVRGLVRSLHSNFGFDTRNAILMNTAPAMAGYKNGAISDMQKRLIKAIEAVPGVDAVGFVDEPPLYGGGINSYIFGADAADLRPAKAAARSYRFIVSEGYLRAAGTTLLTGRNFTNHDDEHSPRVAIVNRQFAARIFGSPDKAVGQYFKLRDGSRIQVVGIVEDGKYFTLAEDPALAMFMPVWQNAAIETWLVVRSTRDPAQIAPALKDALRSLDRALPSYISPWASEMGFSLFPARMAAFSLGVLGIIGAMLSITGIFGMAAHSISRRLKEIGIRLALGASRPQILQSALGRAVKLLAAGAASGLILGIFASRVLASIVYQATPRDPLVLAGVVFAMAFLGLLATWIPAQRALSLDPLTLLREE